MTCTGLCGLDWITGMPDKRSWCKSSTFGSTTITDSRRIIVNRGFAEEVFVDRVLQRAALHWTAIASSYVRIKKIKKTQEWSTITTIVHLLCVRLLRVTAAAQPIADLLLLGTFVSNPRVSQMKPQGRQWMGRQNREIKWSNAKLRHSWTADMLSA